MDNSTCLWRLAMSDKLTPLRQAFCEQYVIDRNATQAAIRAGYKESNAYASGCYLLNQPAIVKRIAELDEEIRERNKITKDSIIRDICEIRDRCMQRVPVMNFDRENKEFVQRIDIETGLGVWTFDAQNALKACDMLAKHIGFYEADKDKTNINVLAMPNVDDLLRIKRMLDNNE